jgi:UDP-N-acetylglucosamine 2-epimerase (non-hydrolysing)
MKILHVVGTRPNFMKTAPIMASFDEGQAQNYPTVQFEQVLVHTGQHYDDEMSAVFFRDLHMRQPDVYLDVRSGTHAQQTGRLMCSLEAVFAEHLPNLVIVVGDVNSTLAAALVAAKLNIPVAHVESGLRSYDRRMPEEINRLVTDRVSNLLFTTSQAASKTLTGDGADPSLVHFVGNTMIDCLEATLPLAAERDVAGRIRLVARGFALVTLHRPSNVDDDVQLTRLMNVLLDLALDLPVAFPVHARTLARLEALGILGKLKDCPSVRVLPPLGYVDFLSLLGDARLVLTDSGGIQAETCVLGTPCLTARTTTEWTETLTTGINTLVDPYDPAALLAAARRLLEEDLPESGFRPPLWDGHAAKRIVAIIREWAAGRV